MQNTIAVSTWSLHKMIGISFSNGPGTQEPFIKESTWGVGTLDIFDIPAALASRGYRACELCHFHVGSLDRDYLKRLATAFDDAGVELQTLLIDDGDITNADTRDRDMAWIKTWIDAAVTLRARHVRVIAGKQKPSAPVLAVAVESLHELKAYGDSRGVKVATENWFDTLSTPSAVHHVLDHVPGLGFMADTGNWSGPTKYDDLASIFARADLCHAKAHFEPGLQLDETDFSACLDAAKRGDYRGPMTLIFADDDDEWAGLTAERKFIEEHAISRNRRQEKALTELS